MAERLAKKVLLIGWDAADWKVINPLMDAGQMPALESLVNRGVMGNIATLDPPLSPMLWTSIATGKTADQHGVLGFIEPNEDGTGLRPVLGTSRKAKAIWNILNQSGLRSNVVGWWPSHPAEPINGVTVSNFYHKATTKVFEEWPLPPGCIHPPELAEVLGPLRVHPGELTGNHLLPFVPAAEEIEGGAIKTLSMVAKIIADASTLQSVATWLLDNTDWDFMAVYFDAIDHFGHGFMKYHPPHRQGVPEQGYKYFKGVVDAGYRFHDMMLESLLQAAGEDTTVILLSDHGFHSDHLRPLGLPQEPAGPAHEHRDFGIFVMAGLGIRQDERVYGTSLLDVAPTVLALFGLPIGKDMAGKPVVDAFTDQIDPEIIDSWEAIDGDSGMHAPDTLRDPWAEQEAMKQLVELGYIEPGEGAENVEKTVRESQFYLARVYINRGRFEKALPLLTSIFDADPESERYGLRLTEVLRRLKRFDEAHKVLDRTIAAREELLSKKLDRLKSRLAQLEEAATSHEKEERREFARKQGQKLAIRESRVRQKLENEPAGVSFHRGLIYLESGDPEKALSFFKSAEEKIRNSPALHLRIGESYLLLDKWDDADGALSKALLLDAELAPAHRGLALAHLRRDAFQEAIAASLEAIGLRYFYPEAHFHLGEAFMRLGLAERAAEAFKVSVQQNPKIKLAHLYLAQLYRSSLKDNEKADEHMRYMAEHFE